MKKYLADFLLTYIKFFAKIQLNKVRLIQKIKKQPLLTIGITGSAGKTSTLKACQAALSPHFVIKTNQGYNSESGLPLSLLNLKITNYNLFSWFLIIILAPIKIITNWQSYQLLILEMGIDSPFWPKNMDYLLSITSIDIAIILNISSVHLINFKSIDQLAQEKLKLANQAKTVIVNPNDKLIKKYNHNKNTIEIIPTKIKMDNYYLPQIYQLTFGAATTLAKTLNIPLNQAIKNIKDNLILPLSRSSILKGIKDTTIIDSSYNSSPLATKELLDFLSTFKTKKIAILGDMRELGSKSQDEHIKIYQQATKTADIIISVGSETKKYFGPQANKFDNWWTALNFLKHQIKGKETILIKGSQNTIYLEELIKGILKNKSDSKKLCRQSPYWLKIKNQFKQKN